MNSRMRAKSADFNMDIKDAIESATYYCFDDLLDKYPAAKKEVKEKKWTFSKVITEGIIREKIKEFFEEGNLLSTKDYEYLPYELRCRVEKVRVGKVTGYRLKESDEPLTPLFPHGDVHHEGEVEKLIDLFFK